MPAKVSKAGKFINVPEADTYARYDEDLSEWLGGATFSISGDEVVEIFRCNSPVFDADLSNCTAMASCTFGVHLFGALILAGCAALIFLSVQSEDAGGVTIDLTGCASLVRIDLQMNNISESLADSVLTQLDALGASNGTLYMVGAEPSSEGLTAKTNLENRGWTVVLSE